MAPTAIVLSPENLAIHEQDAPSSGRTLEPSTSANTTVGSTLVIGSQTTAQDGKYQSTIMNSSNSAGGLQRVEKQMLDRILDNGKLTADTTALVTLTKLFFLSYNIV